MLVGLDVAAVSVLVGVVLEGGSADGGKMSGCGGGATGVSGVARRAASDISASVLGVGASRSWLDAFDWSNDCCGVCPACEVATTAAVWLGITMPPVGLTSLGR